MTEKQIYKNNIWWQWQKQQFSSCKPGDTKDYCSHQELQEAGRNLTQSLQRAQDPANILISGSCSLEQWENRCVLCLVPQFAVLCYSGHRSLVHNMFGLNFSCHHAKPEKLSHLFDSNKLRRWPNDLHMLVNARVRSTKGTDGVWLRDHRSFYHLLFFFCLDHRVLSFG